MDARVAGIAHTFYPPLYRTNISANSVSAGCDLTALFPRFIVNPSFHAFVLGSTYLHRRISDAVGIYRQLSDLSCVPGT
jgi:hypothetical protein